MKFNVLELVLVPSYSLLELNSDFLNFIIKVFLVCEFLLVVNGHFWRPKLSDILKVPAKTLLQLNYWKMFEELFVILLVVDEEDFAECEEVHVF